MKLRNNTLLLISIFGLFLFGLSTLLDLSGAPQKVAKTKEEQFQEKLAKVKENDAKGYYELGRWCDTNKMPEKAMEMYEKTIQADPNHSGARQKLGFIKYKNKWIKKGEEPKIDYEEKLSGLKENDIEGHYKLAIWCKEKKLSDEAMTEFEKVVKLDPEHEKARKELGYEKYKDQWLTKKQKEDIENKEKGMLKYGDTWVKPEEMEKVREKDRAAYKWDLTNKFNTKIFTIFTNLEDEKEKQDIAEAGDDVYAAFAQFLEPYVKKDILKKKLPVITMHVFQTSEQMKKNCQARGIQMASQYGFAMGNESFQAKDTCQTIMDSIREVILHEGAHILDTNFIGPIRSENYWIVEGISSYFQSLQKDQKGKFILGERKDMWELRGPTKYHELEKFCNFDRKLWDAEIDKAGNYNIIYCQASTLFRYFMTAENGKYREKFIKEVVIGRRGSSKDLAQIFGFSSVNDIEDKYIEFANTIYNSKISKNK